MHVESRMSIYQEIGEAQEVEEVQPPNDEIQWMKWKMQLLETGECNYYHIKHKFQTAPEGR